MTNSREKIMALLLAERPKMFQYVSYKVHDINAVEDILQDVTLKFLSEPEKYASIENIRAYVYRTLSNTCMNYLRDSAKQSVLTEEEFGAIDSQMLQPENFEDEFEMINRLLAFLPEEQSETIRLRIHSSLPFAEIAEIMEVPLPTAKARFRYGIEKLRDGLKKNGLI